MNILNRSRPKTEETDRLRLMVVDSLLVFHSSDHASKNVKSHHSFLVDRALSACVAYVRHQQDGYTVPPKFVDPLYKDSVPSHRNCMPVNQMHHDAILVPSGGDT